MRSIRPLLLALLLLLALAPAANAQTAAPGVSALDEYQETIPGAGGDTPTDGKPNGNALSPAARASLARLGADGRRAAALAAQTAPADAPAKGKTAASTNSAGRRTRSQQTPDGSSATSGRPPIEATVHAVAAPSGGMGLLLPVLLACATVAAGGAAFLARRRRT